MKKVSIIDVAREAGVSVSTVSLVLRQKGKISAPTIARVQEVIARLGYVHNVTAANLRASTSNLIGLIVEDFSDSFTVKVAASVVDALELQGMMVFVTRITDTSAQLASRLLALQRQGVAGVLYLSASSRQEALPAELYQLTLPLVVISQSPKEGRVNRVERDNYQAAVTATRYLIDRGHRQIAYIGGEEDCLMRRQRLAGVRWALNQAGLTAQTRLMPACSADTAAAASAVRHLLAHQAGVSALLCHSAHVVIGAYSALRTMGRTVGKDIFLTSQTSVLGFEEMLQVNLTSPSLTWVSPDSEEIGRQAASLLLRLTEESGPVQQITLTGYLMAGESA
ncbi:LacI family transcriptional regulator [Salmonella enterica subsp. enterica serovar Choleraesuis]|nr:LacI family transcriptional regulator [Salmonella enterica subsp. enterica serovar Choleraesuis]